MSYIPVLDQEEFMAFALKRASELSMGVHKASLSVCDGWKVTQDVIFHPNRRRFYCCGIHIHKIRNREVSGRAQPMICEETVGHAAVVVCRNLVLVRLKAEPGNIGIQVEGNNTRVLVAPPIQFSRSNLEHNQRALRGETDEGGQAIKPVPLAGLLSHGRYRPIWHPVPQDGNRFYEKVDFVAAVSISSLEEINQDFEGLSLEDRRDFAWIDREMLFDLMRKGYASPYLWFCAVAIGI